MRRAFPLTLILLVLAGVGCRREELTTLANRQPAKVYRKVVSLSPSATEVIGRYASVELLKGRTTACNYPETVASVPVVASVKPEYEKIAQIAPDLLVYDAVLYNESDVAKMKGVGETFAFKGNTVDEYMRELGRLGALLTSESNFSGYVDRIASERIAAQSDMSDPKPKVVLLLPGRGSAHMILGTGSFLADVVRAAGGEPVGPEADRFVPLNPETLVTLNPDVLVVAEGKPGTGASAIVSDPRFRTVKAITTKRAHLVSPDLALRRGARVDELIGVLHTALTKGAGQ